MVAADQHSGSAPAGPPALKRELSYTCSRGAPEPMHDRKLSHSYSFSTAAASPSAASSSSALSSKASCESIPVPADPDSSQSSFSFSSSYESFYQIETTAAEDGSEPARQPPAVQTMMAMQGQPAAGYEPKRLPSSIFRTQSRCAAEWSANSNESLFSIRLGSHSGEVGDLYYDAAGVFHSLSSVSESGGLCVKGDCATCTGSGSGATDRKSVRFAATESISGRVVSSTLPAAPDEEEGQEAPATEAKEPAAAAEGGWCVFGNCCPPMWWPCCACCGCGCGDCRSS